MSDSHAELHGEITPADAEQADTATAKMFPVAARVSAKVRVALEARRKQMQLALRKQGILREATIADAVHGALVRGLCEFGDLSIDADGEV